jgi:hypothetical protein
MVDSRSAVNEGAELSQKQAKSVENEWARSKCGATMELM